MSEKVSESAIQKTILAYLAARHVFALRINSGMMISTYKGKSYRTALCAPGTADILAFPRKVTWEDQGLVPVWLEVKSATGKQSEIQKSFQAQVEDEGHKYFIVRSIEDVEAALR